MLKMNCKKIVSVHNNNYYYYNYNLTFMSMAKLYKKSIFSFNKLLLS